MFLSVAISWPRKQLVQPIQYGSHSSHRGPALRSYTPHFIQGHHNSSLCLLKHTPDERGGWLQTAFSAAKRRCRDLKEARMGGGGGNDGRSASLRILRIKSCTQRTGPKARKDGREGGEGGEGREVNAPAGLAQDDCGEMFVICPTKVSWGLY